MLRGLFSGILVSLFLSLAAVPSSACLPIGRNGMPIRIAEETAVIFWDSETKTEHFIRRARFVTDSADLAFLVPTPTKPDLVDVGENVFGELQRFTNPPPPPQAERGAKYAAPSPRLTTDSVRVLEKKQVGNFDATILEATDARALSEWLKKNDYPSSPEIEDWLVPYLKDKWILTAYKIAAKSKDGTPLSGFMGSTIRMSFKADKPFYPYREPKSTQPAKPNAKSNERSLRVYFLSQEAHDAKLLDSPWTRSIPFAGRLTPAVEERVMRDLKLPERKEQEPLFLTEFEDYTEIRSTGAEVVFLPSSDIKPVSRPAQTQTMGYSGPSTSWNDADRDLAMTLFRVGAVAVLFVAFIGWSIFRRFRARVEG